MVAAAPIPSPCPATLPQAAAPHAGISGTKVMWLWESPQFVAQRREVS